MPVIIIERRRAATPKESITEGGQRSITRKARIIITIGRAVRAQAVRTPQVRRGDAVSGSDTMRSSSMANAESSSRATLQNMIARARAVQSIGTITQVSTIARVGRHTKPRTIISTGTMKVRVTRTMVGRITGARIIREPSTKRGIRDIRKVPMNS